MMRFARAALLPLLLLSCFATLSSAQTFGAFPVLREKTVNFRHFTTPATSRNTGYLGTTVIVGWNDSLSTFWNSSNTQAALVADTTEWFSLDGLARISNSVTTTAGVNDSLGLFHAILMPDYAQNTVAGADSFQFTLQASFNGIDLQAAPAVDLLELGTSNCFSRAYNAVSNISTAATATNVSLGAYPLFRLIVKDFTGTTGMYAMKIRWWSAR